MAQVLGNQIGNRLLMEISDYVLFYRLIPIFKKAFSRLN
jgi:hypothetical protein